MADDEMNAVADEFVGDRDALLGIGDVVALLDRDLLAEDAARLVEVIGRLTDALRQLRAKRRVRPGDRTGDADRDLGVSGAAHQQDGGQRQAREKGMFHFNLLIGY